MTTLQRRLQALEQHASRARSEDTPEARAVGAYLESLFAEHDPGGLLRQRYEAEQENSQPIFTLLDRAGPRAWDHVLDLIAAAEGRPRTPIN